MMNEKQKIGSRVNHPLARTPAVECGSCVVQEVEGGAFFVMLPGGQVSCKPDKASAEKHCCRYFKSVCPVNEISLGHIKWSFLPKTQVSEVLQPT